jgi:hypothetical protein
MDRSESPEPDRSRPQPGGTAYEALRRLEDRIERAADVAERLVTEAAARAAGAAQPECDPGGERPAAGSEPAVDGAGSNSSNSAAGDHKPPPAGWQVPRGHADRRAPGDLELFAHVIHSLRDLIPPELQRRLAEALRELLLALRALIDWYLERTDLQRRKPAEVQDIPIL